MKKMDRERKPTFKLKRGHSLLRDKIGVVVSDKVDAEFLYWAGLVPEVYLYVDGKTKKCIGVSVPFEQYELGMKLIEWKRERDDKEKQKRGRKFGSRG